MKAAALTLVACVAALLALGIVMLYSSVGAHYLVMQLIWGAAGLVLLTLAAALDYRLWKKWSPVLLVVTVVLLALVLDRHFGTRIIGARRWFTLGWMRVQPSELAKLSVIVALAWYCDRFQRRINGWRYGVLFPALILAPVLGLIFVEPDRGTTILLAALSGIILLVAGVRMRCIVLPALAVAALVVCSIARDPIRMRRVEGWLHPQEKKEGAGYQVNQGIIALGAGGWTGLGLGNGRQKRGFLPEHHTDFILPIIGEELGVAATLLVVLLFAGFFFCGLRISWRSSDMFGRLLAFGTTLMITLQAMYNIAVVTGCMPTKGLPLPFISFGGSSLVTSLLGVGVLLNIARHAGEEFKDDDTRIVKDRLHHF